jgi:molecular chaperone DnaK
LDKKKDSKIAVFDFGGGTFDISILEVGDRVVEVLSTNGDTHLGGDDIDRVLVEYLAAEFKKDQGIDVLGDKMVIQRLREAAEKAKIELSATLETDVNLPFLTADQTGPKHLNIKLTRAKFEELTRHVIERTKEPTQKALSDAGLSVKEIDEVVLVGGSTRIPAVQKIVSELFGKQPHQGVNPDEVVGLGAAVQGAVLSGGFNDVLLLDVSPLSLGIETLGGVMTKLIERNSTIPCRKSEIFSTAADGQTSVEVHVLQGERSMANDNRTLGRFNLDGLPPTPRGTPQIEVVFDIDANGIVNVSATDKSTGKEQHITITNGGGLSKEEIENAVRESERNAADDEKRRNAAQLRNEADHTTAQIQRVLDEHRDKIDQGTVSVVQQKLEQVRQLLDSNDLNQLQQSLDELKTLSQKMGEAIYQKQSGGAQQQSQPQANWAPPSGTSDDEVIDAEFRES